jgi:hypothetical protein
VTAAIEQYRTARRALEGAEAILVELENRLDAERDRLATRDADTLAGGSSVAPLWSDDVTYASTLSATQSARAVVRKCREQLKHAAATARAAQQDFFDARRAAANTAIAGWREKFWPTVLAAAAEGKLLERTYEVDIDELDHLPEVAAPAGTAVVPNAWGQAAWDLEKIVKAAAAMDAAAGRWRAVSSFEYGEFDVAAGQILEEGSLPDSVVLRLATRGVLVSCDPNKDELRVNVIQRPRSGVPRSAPEPVKIDDSLDLIGGLQRGAQTPSGESWDSTGPSRRSNFEG